MIDKEKADDILAFIRNNIKLNLSDYLTDVFAYPGFSKTKLSIEDIDFKPFTISIGPDYSEGSNSSEEAEMLFWVECQDSEAQPRALFTKEPSGRPFAQFRMMVETCGHVLFGSDWRKYSRQAYIPAARTGLMLALPALQQQAFSQSPEQAQPLPATLKNFIRLMLRSPASFGREANIAGWLSERILTGTIASKSERTGDFRYIPNGLPLELPFHATSSMITELAPLLIALERSFSSRHIVFEEPEAHLHLEAQREMARLIARLVASGWFVTLTTHSDTFLQEINNLMKLHGLSNKEELMPELGYDEADLIDPLVARAYEFRPSQVGTEVVELERTQDGFVVPSLNETLLALAMETLQLRDADDN